MNAPAVVKSGKHQRNVRFTPKRAANSSNDVRLLDAPLRLEFDRRVAAVAERLVLRSAAAANGHAVANFVLVAVRRR